MVAVLVLLPVRPPALQRMSVEETEVTGELWFVLRLGDVR